MKKFIAITMASAMTVSALAGCASNGTAGNNDNTKTESTETAQTTEDTADIQSMSDEIKDMVEPADAILRCMVENNMEYNPDDSLFFWRALYYFAGAYSQGDTDVEYNDETGELTVPRHLMRAYASVISSEYTDLPAIPAEMSANVVYNPDNDSYILYTGDVGLAESKITSFSDNGDGTYNITVELRSKMDDTIIASGDFKLVKNEYAYDIIDPPYIYSIASLDYKVGE